MTKYRNVFINDMHCGSDRAVMPPTIKLPPLMADDKERVLHATNNQVEIYNHIMQTADRIKKSSEGYKKIIIVAGDAIEGLHHYTIQLAAPTVDDHIEIHLTVMREFLRRIGFSRKAGDELHYISGTESHTGYSEAYIVKCISNEFGILQPSFSDILRLNQNGKSIAITHQWTGVGNGVSEGNAIYNSLKNMYYNSLKENWRMPDLTIGAHYHKCGLGVFAQDWKIYHGLVLPSLQRKTRYAHQKTAFQRNDIGIVTVDVLESGAFLFERYLLHNEQAV